MNKKNEGPVTGLFYEDFLTSGLLSVEYLDGAIERAQQANSRNLRGIDTSIFYAEDEDREVARLIISTDVTPAQVLINFAGVEIDMPLPKLRNDLARVEQAA